MRIYNVTEVVLNEDDLLRAIFDCLDTTYPFKYFVGQLSIKWHNPVTVSRSITLYKLLGDLRKCKKQEDFLAFKKIRMDDLRVRSNDNRKFMQILGGFFEKNSSKYSDLVLASMLVTIIGKNLGVKEKADFNKINSFVKIVDFFAFLRTNKIIVNKFKKEPDMLIELSRKNVYLGVNNKTNILFSLFPSEKLVNIFNIFNIIQPS